MQNTQSITTSIIHLWKHLKVRRRWQFSVLLVLMALSSFSEMLSIGAVLPFLAVLTDPKVVFEHPEAQPFIHLIGITTADQLLLPLTVAFGFAALLAGAMRLLLLWASTKLSFAAGADISNSIYERTLYQPYAIHVARNSSEVISGISNKAHMVIYGVIVPVLTLLSASFMLVTILIAIFYVEPIIAILAFGGFGSIYAIIIWFTRKRLLIDSQCISRESVNVIKSLQEGLGGIRDVLIDGSQATYCKIYRSADQSLRRAQGSNLFVSQSPRYLMEALGMLLIAILAYTLADSADGVTKAIPVLGALALGAQRLLPVLQQAYSAIVNIRGGQVPLQDTLELLDQPLPDYVSLPTAKPLPFQKSISFNNVSFRYNNDTPRVLESLCLTIAKGSRVGIIGTTGSGKSTLIDIVMGLLLPDSGQLLVDDEPVTSANSRSWQAHIAHVPQVIFLADSTVGENIAFGVPKDKIDFQRVRQAAMQAQISEFIESLPEGYQTSVGERGVRLSGGQRQRIGIARALYKQSDVIIFDEATSALDSETEEAVMDAVERLSQNLTILIVAHRLTTLKNCNQIVQLDNGRIKKIGTYKEVVSMSI